MEIINSIFTKENTKAGEKLKNQKIDSDVVEKNKEYSIVKQENNKSLIFKDKKEIKSILIKLKEKLIFYAKNIFSVSLSAQIVLIPIIAYNYNTISLTFFITNILTSFLIGVIIIFGFVLILISIPFLKIAKIFGKIYKMLIDLLVFITKNTAKIPLSKIYLKKPFLWEIVLYYIFIFSILYLFKKFRKREI